MPSINTTRVANRRELHFTKLSDIGADAAQLAAAKHVEALGNWTVGQAFEHLALGMDASLDGATFRAPLFFRLIGPLLIKKRILKEMRPGFKGPGPLNPALSVPTDQALAHLQSSLARSAVTGRREPHFILGRMTREEHDQLHLRHAELHLSFFRPVDL